MSTDASETAAEVAAMPDNEAVAFLVTPDFGRNAYSVRPSSMRSYSKWSAAAKAWFRATFANVRRADAKVKARTTVRTIADLNPTVAAREANIRRWATANAGCWRKDGRKAEIAIVPTIPTTQEKRVTIRALTTPRATIPETRMASGLTIPTNRRTSHGPSLKLAA